MTRAEERTVAMCINGFAGPISLLWPYLALCLQRPLTEADKAEIGRKYLGHKE